MLRANSVQLKSLHRTMLLTVGDHLLRKGRRKCYKIRHGPKIKVLINIGKCTLYYKMYLWKSAQPSAFFTPRSSLPNIPITPEISEDMGDEPWMGNVNKSITGKEYLLLLFRKHMQTALHNMVFCLFSSSSAEEQTQGPVHARQVLYHGVTPPTLVSLTTQLSLPKSEPLKYTGKVEAHTAPPPYPVPGWAEWATSPTSLNTAL